MDDPKYGVNEIEPVTNGHDGRFLVIERDGKFLADPAGASVQKKVYEIDLTGATDINGKTNSSTGLLVNGQTLKSRTVAQLTAAGIKPVAKQLFVDMLSLGYPHDKLEGVTVVDRNTIAVSNDDDFGITDGATGGIAQKTLPARNGAIDHNEVWFIRFTHEFR